MLYKDPQNNIHYLDSAEFEHMLPAGSVQLTDAEAEELRPKPIPLTYKELRTAAYPPLTDYLDGIVKSDSAQVQSYVDACLAVKAKYPKS